MQLSREFGGKELQVATKDTFDLDEHERKVSELAVELKPFAQLMKELGRKKRQITLFSDDVEEPSVC